VENNENELIIKIKDEHMKTTTINSLTKLLTTLAEQGAKLLPVLQVIAIIIALVVIGLMVWKGKA
jgi:hypothetical protein